MARIGGRRAWLAWPSAIVCIAVVGALLWLAVPGIPGAVRFAGDVLRGGAEAAAEAVPSPTPTLGNVATTDCRSVYPDRLWSELTWTPDVLLRQDTSAPDLAATPLVAALAPQVLLSCGWRAPQGSIVTTVASIRGDTAGVVRASLTARGYACDDVPSGVRCAKASDGVDEEIEVRGDRWLATSYRGWHPDAYGPGVAARVWR